MTLMIFVILTALIGSVIDLLSKRNVQAGSATRAKIGYILHNNWWLNRKIGRKLDKSSGGKGCVYLDVERNSSKRVAK